MVGKPQILPCVSLFVASQPMNSCCLFPLQDYICWGSFPLCSATPPASTQITNVVGGRGSVRLKGGEGGGLLNL